VHTKVANCCAHSVCTQGAALDAASCVDCVSDVCAIDPFCCVTGWDAVCVTAAKTSSTCKSPSSGAYTCQCAHSYCTVGSALDEDCDPCVAEICSSDPYCCSTNWDNLCVQSVASTCHVPAANCQ
jgi:hypothetical protein